MFVETEYVVVFQEGPDYYESERGYTEDEAWEAFEESPSAVAVERWVTTWSGDEAKDGDLLDRDYQELGAKEATA